MPSGPPRPRFPDIRAVCLGALVLASSTYLPLHDARACSVRWTARSRRGCTCGWTRRKFARLQCPWTRYPPARTCLLSYHAALMPYFVPPLGMYHQAGGGASCFRRTRSAFLRLCSVPFPCPPPPWWACGFSRLVGSWKHLPQVRWPYTGTG